MNFTLISHRGISSEAPENTFPAFDLALNRGFPFIELDVHLTSDNVPVVIHDDTVDRTTNGSGYVASKTLDEIESLDAGHNSDFTCGDSIVVVPTLKEVLTRYHNKAHIYIEVKSEQIELSQLIAQLVKDTGWHEDSQGGPSEVPGLTIISFHLNQIIESLKIMPQFRHGLLRMRSSVDDIQLIRELGISGLYPHISSLTEELVNPGKSHRIIVGAWGIKTMDELTYAFNTGAFGAIVDWPDLALRHLSGANPTEST